MKIINGKAKEWCGEYSNKGCTQQCDGCWQLKQAWGCEQHNMETAYIAGANYVLEQIEEALNKSFDELSIKDGYLEARKCIEQLKE